MMSRERAAGRGASEASPGDQKRRGTGEPAVSQCLQPGWP